MKKLALIIVSALFIQSNVSAQFGEPCLPDGITFTTQAEVDNFQINYPNCTRVEGDLTITGVNITNLNGLNVVTSIGGNLNIGNYNKKNYVLTNLVGLENVTSIGGDVSIAYNVALTSLTGMDNVTSIGGDLSINSNNALSSIVGLDYLTSIGGDLYIRSNDSLSSCDALWLCNYLSNPNGSVNIYNNATGCNNPPEIANACGINLPCLPFGNYYFSTQDEIDNFSVDYPSCTTLLGDVVITGYSITNLNGLNAVTSIGGNLLINYVSNLTNLTGLNNVASIGGTLSIHDNPNLTMTDLENLTSIAGSLVIGIHHEPPGVGIGNIALKNLSGLDNLTSLGGNLTVQHNDSLISLTGLENVDSIGGGLMIAFNNSLTSLTGLDNVDSIPGSLSIYGNNALASLSGLDNVTSVEGNLSIGSFIGRGGYVGNDALANLSGLDNLISVDGSLNIYANDDLTSLTGLENVAAIGGSLSIRYNASITSLSGLDNIATDSITDLYITDNTSLSTCEVQWLCNYLANPSGTVNIYNNAPGCINPSEVANFCGITLPCLPFGNYYFFTQAEIDNFPTNYPGCTELEGDITIEGDDITNLNGLSVLTYIGGNLRIGYTYNSYYDGNPSLESLTSLSNLTSIGGGLWIQGNDALTSLTGLDNIDAASIASLIIVRNASLSACEVQSVCDYLAKPNGEIYIHDNAPGCNSQAEVEAACFVGLEESLVVSRQSSGRINPNPFSSSTTIEYELSRPGTVRITIFNQLGGLVYANEQRQAQGLNKVVWTPGNLPNGIYYLRLQAGEQLASGKMMLMR